MPCASVRIRRSGGSTLGRLGERRAVLTSRLESFEAEVLTQEESFAGLAALSRDLLNTADAIASLRWVVTGGRRHAGQDHDAAVAARIK